MEIDHDPGPVPESEDLTDEQYANLHNTVDVMHFIFTQMLQDLPASGSVDAMDAPFQPLVRAVMIAAVQYYRDNGQAELAQRAQALLDSGKLDSASVARAPSAGEVAELLMELHQQEPSTSIAAEFSPSSPTRWTARTSRRSPRRRRGEAASPAARRSRTACCSRRVR